MEYKDYNDYELLNYIAEEDENSYYILLEKYRPLINNLSLKFLKKYKACGVEVNDLNQEGMLALSRAIKTFDYKGDTSFYTYVKSCVENALNSYMIGTTRLKQKILNDAISIEASKNGKNINLEYLFKNDSINPENILINEEDNKELIDIVNNCLTDFEIQVLKLKISGMSYKEISVFLDKDIKAIDNAMQRIRSKIKKEYSNAI